MTILDDILALKEERQATILAHNYQIPEVQDVADLVGDSLELSRAAARLDSEIIIFCGVDFMAETAAILSPQKKVILPEKSAGCPMAHMITPEQLCDLKNLHPKAAVVCYVNSTAEIKAESDVCCTSANGVQVVSSLSEKEVIFVPDRNLAAYVARNTDKKIIPWNGYCPVHHFLTPEEVARTKALHPGAPFAAHPECRTEVLAMADFVGSTAGIIRFAAKSSAREIIIGTEEGVIVKLKKEFPDRTFIPASGNLICSTMKLTTLEDIRDALLDMKHVIRVPEEIRVPAKRAIDRMLALY